MQYNPHEYQRFAIKYIETHPIAAILLDMGLGKSSIDERIRKALSEKDSTQTALIQAVKANLEVECDGRI